MVDLVSLVLLESASIRSKYLSLCVVELNLVIEMLCREGRNVGSHYAGCMGQCLTMLTHPVVQFS